jgi:hypothetical protein
MAQNTRIIYYQEACIFMKLVSCTQFHEIKLTPDTSSATNGTYRTSTMEYTGCNRRNGPDFRRVFLMLNYTEKPQNTYIQS